MTKLKQIYRCNICGNIVEIVHTGAGELVCCDEPMELLAPKSEDTGYEKHVPVVEKTESGYKVNVGSNPHPMVEEHYIEWIELVVDGVSYRKFLKPGDDPSAEFCIGKLDEVYARAYCNVHSLWSNK